MRIRPINPVARIMAHNSRRTATQVVPNKTQYNRKKEQDRENKTRKDND